MTEDCYDSKKTVEEFKESLNNLAKNFEMDISSIEINSSCILYQVINDEFSSDTNSIRI